MFFLCKQSVNKKKRPKKSTCVPLIPPLPSPLACRPSSPLSLSENHYGLKAAYAHVSQIWFARLTKAAAMFTHLFSNQHKS